MPQSTQKLAAFVFGVAFVIAMITLAIWFPAPTPFQYTVFRIVLALAVAGVAVMFPGFISVAIPGYLRAGGALAVFVIVYFYSPAPLLGIRVPVNVQLSLHRPGSTTDCPTLAESASVRLIPVAGGPELTARIFGGCKAQVAMPASDAGMIKLELVDAAPYVLSHPDATYSLSDNHWEVSVTDTPRRRLLISLFSYAGQCQNMPSTYTMFETILRSKAQSLRGLFADSDKRYDYLNGVNVLPTGQLSTMSTNEIHSYWQGNGSLQVLSGICFVKPDGDVMRSSIFSGTLSGALPEPYVVDLKVDEREFATTRDLYSASILFALAQEAKSQNADQDVIISYLERSRELVAQIQDNARQPLLAAINRALADVGAPTGVLTH
jgi:hypothetical protein